MEVLTGRRRKRSEEESPSYPLSKVSKVTNEPPAGTSNNSKSSLNKYLPKLYQSVVESKTKIPSELDKDDLLKEIPCDTEAALLYIRNLWPKELFRGRLPPIMLRSQLTYSLKNQRLVDTQLAKLVKTNKIVTFSTFSSSNFLIVFFNDYVEIEREGVFQRFVTEVLGSSEIGNYRSIEHSKYYCKEDLKKFEENEIRQLVNGGYLGIQDGGMYCLSLPGAGEFIKWYERGKKQVLGAIKRAKFGEILQSTLLERPMKKSAPLGLMYHLYDLIGSGEISKMDTTSGPLLKIKKTSV